MSIPKVIFAVVPVTGREHVMYSVCVKSTVEDGDGFYQTVQVSDDLPSKQTAQHIANMMCTAIKNIGFDSRVEES